MEISKSDMERVIAYLDDAAELYRIQPKPKHQWRATLIKQLTKKLKRKLNTNA